MQKFGERWNTYKWPAVCATTGMIWMPVEPVPITPTRLPDTSTPPSGQCEEWYHWPLNRSRQGNSGTRKDDRLPLAMMQ